jgi:3-oxoacid CoA-transferase subunit A
VSLTENAPMELAYKADFAIVKAWKGDGWEFDFKGTARNLTDVWLEQLRSQLRVEEFTTAGMIGSKPNSHTRIMQRIFKGEKFEKRLNNVQHAKEIKPWL